MSTARDTPLLAALVCSGFAALGYEIVWTRLCTPMLGSETLGVLATLAGFFGGMALGAALWHRRAANGPDPLGLFVRLELVAAGFAVVSPYLLHALARAIPAWLGPVAGSNDSPAAVAAALGIAAALMLPGTLCMGATLAAVTEARRRVCNADDDARGIGRLYAANTIGALLGVLVTVHVVAPVFGLAHGAAFLAGFGALAAFLARRWGRDQSIPTSPRPIDAAPIDASRDPDPEVQETLPLLLLLTGTGVVGVGLEVAGVLVLSQVLENTIYTFANVLAIYLGGTAIGAWVWSSRGAAWSRSRPATTAAVLLLALAAATVLASLALGNAREIVEAIAPKGSSFDRHLLAELAAAACVFTVPTVLMGATFSHAMGLVAPAGVGRAYALNTAGGAIAPFVFGVWAPLELGYRDGFLLVVYGYLLVFGVFTWFRRFGPKVQIVAILGVVALTGLAPKSLVIVEPEDGWTVLAERQSPMGLVIVSEKSDTANHELPLRRLQIGDEFRMGGALSFGEQRMGHLPLLLAPTAKRALFLGVGTGATLGAVRSFDTLEQIDAVELVPAVLDQLHHFAKTNANVADDPRVRLHAADARRFVAASRDRYDVVVADLFHPGIDGAGSLYAREHFENVAAHLTEGGLFAQWLPLYQLDAETLPIVVCTFASVFPEAHAFLGIYNARTPAVALVGREGGAPLQIDVAALEAQLRLPVYRKLLMQDARDPLASHLLDPAGVAALCGDHPQNTDFRPYLTLYGPRVAYEGMAEHGPQNLATMLALRQPLGAEALRRGGPDHDAFVASVHRFGEALALYLEGELLRAQDPGGAAPTAAVERYFEAYTREPDFTAAHGMLLESARQSPELAESILPRVLAQDPDDLEAWKRWLAHLRKIGDTERFEAARAEAEARFGPGKQ